MMLRSEDWTAIFNELEKRELLNAALDKLNNWQTIPRTTRKVLFLTAVGTVWDNIEGRDETISPLFHSLGSDEAVRMCLRDMREIAGRYGEQRGQ